MPYVLTILGQQLLIVYFYDNIYAIKIKWV